MTSTLEIGAFRRGPGGRPTREEAERRHRDLLETARRLLLERGWEATSIDEISRQSGVAKRFLYTRYPDKAALFVAAIERFRDDKIAALDALGALPDDVEEGLVAFGQRLLDFALQEETLAVLRLFIAEAHRFRDQAKGFFERSRRNGPAVILHVLTAYAARGAIELADPQFAAEHFFILVAGVPQRLALLAGRETPDQEARHLRSAVHLFLDGCRKRGGVERVTAQRA